MGQLTITLSDKLEEQVREHVKKQGYDSVSDFVREAVTNATSGRPTYWERACISHSMEIKHALGQQVNEKLLDALKKGYPKYYLLEEQHTTREEMSDESMEFVHSVLDMYSVLQSSYIASNVEDPVVNNKILFEGFDTNANDGYFYYLQFLVGHDLYTYVKPLDEGHAIDSHSKSVNGMYERMLEVYKSINRDGFDRRPLTLDEIKSVLERQTYKKSAGLLY